MSPTWAPGAPWPTSRPGGAVSPDWGGYLKVWVEAGIAPGRGWHIGPHANDRLDAGNVVGPVADFAGTGDDTDRLWVDLTCDTLDVDLDNGASRADGIFSRNEAATCHVTLYDPGRKYDPANPDSPYVLGNRSRLVAGTPFRVTVEIVDGATAAVTARTLFTGRVDAWSEDWTPTPAARRAHIIATDAVRQLVHLNWGEQPPTGTNDTTTERMHRIIDYYALPLTINEPATPSTVTLDATTLAVSAWELLNRTMDDELGYVHVRPPDVLGDPATLRWVNRDTWITPDLTPKYELGCSPDAPDAYDIVTDVTIADASLQVRNAIYAARTGGTMQVFRVPASIQRNGGWEADFRRTDLGLKDDTEVADWAQTVGILYAFPAPEPTAVTLLPQLAPEPWAAWLDVLDTLEVTDFVELYWQPPGTSSTTRSIFRVVGVAHTFTRRSWEVGWQVVGAGRTATGAGVFTVGPHANDRLDDGNVIGLAPSPSLKGAGNGRT